MMIGVAAECVDTAPCPVGLCRVSKLDRIVFHFSPSSGYLHADLEGKEQNTP